MGIIEDIKEKNYGDAIERVTKATGIKKAVDTISEATGVPCGCAERKEALNFGKKEQSKKESNMKLYTQKGCGHCDRVNVHARLNVEVIDINDPSYTGFRPQQVPILQFGPITVVGDKDINAVFSSIEVKDA